jgi:HlyD family secretion protein
LLAWLAVPRMKRRALLVVAFLVAVAASVGGTWWFLRPRSPARRLVLHGNVDLRQCELAFQNDERIARVLVEEGERLTAGQLVAELDASRLAPQVAQAEAQVAAQAQVVERMHNGFRPEEIAQARANVESAKADAAFARAQHERLKAMSRGAVSLQDLEAAKATLDVDDAHVIVAERTLDIFLIGYRKEEIAENEAKLRAAEAQLAFLRQQLADAKLVAPGEAVVRSRLMEPGEMSSPQRPVLTLALTDPKWIRCYASERDLGKVHPGMAAAIAVDSFPDQRFPGWVGFVSPVAEFTPKPVEIEELRTSLVYEVRVFVRDPGDVLRLGMPATVSLVLEPRPKGEVAPLDSATIPEGPLERLRR